MKALALILSLSDEVKQQQCSKYDKRQSQERCKLNKLQTHSLSSSDMLTKEQYNSQRNRSIIQYESNCCQNIVVENKADKSKINSPPMKKYAKIVKENRHR